MDFAAIAHPWKLRLLGYLGARDLLNLECVFRDLVDDDVWKRRTVGLKGWKLGGAMFSWKWTYWRAYNWVEFGMRDHRRAQRMGRFKGWLKAKCGIPPKERRRGEYTHLLLDGGKARVTPERQEEFFGRYVEAVSRGERVYVVERRTERYKMFVDLDFRADQPLSREYVLRIASTLQSVMESPAYLCTSQCKVLMDGIKYGVHMIWPEVDVGDEGALMLRNRFISKLGEMEEGGLFDWESVVDVSVYKGSGLRMLWSGKIEKCAHCSPSKGYCAECTGNGRQHSGRNYTFSYLINTDGSVASRKEHLSMIDDRVALLKSCCIADPSLVGVRKSGGGRQRAAGAGKRKRLDETTGIGDPVDIDSAEMRILNCGVLPLMRDWIPLEPTQIRSMQPVVKDKKILSYIVKTDSRDCKLALREHRSSEIFLILRWRGIVQKCFSPHCKGRETPVHNCLSRLYKELLFPQIAADIKKKYGRPPKRRRVKR